MKQLPDKIILGMRVTCPRVPRPEVLSVFKTDPATGRIWLMHENGVAVLDALSEHLLRVMGYVEA